MKLYEVYVTKLLRNYTINMIITSDIYSK